MYLNNKKNKKNLHIAILYKEKHAVRFIFFLKIHWLDFEIACASLFCHVILIVAFTSYRLNWFWGKIIIRIIFLMHYNSDLQEVLLIGNCHCLVSGKIICQNEEEKKNDSRDGWEASLFDHTDCNDAISKLGWKISS